MHGNNVVQCHSLSLVIIGMTDEAVWPKIKQCHSLSVGHGMRHSDKKIRQYGHSLSIHHGMDETQAKK
jgi:hypothetical protein